MAVKAQPADIDTDPFEFITKIYLVKTMDAVIFQLTHDFVKEGRQLSEAGRLEEMMSLYHQERESKDAVENFIGCSGMSGSSDKVKIMRGGSCIKTIIPTVNARFVNIHTGKESKSSKTASTFFKYISKHQLDVDSICITRAEVLLVDRIDRLDAVKPFLKYREHVVQSATLDVDGLNLTLLNHEDEDFNIDTFRGQGFEDMQDYHALIFFKEIDMTIFHK